MAEVRLARDGKVVNVTSSIVTTPLIKSGPCSDMRGSSVREVVCQEDLRCMVVEHQVHESRENSVVRVLYSRCRIEANLGDRIHLEDSVARLVYGGCGVRR